MKRFAYLLVLASAVAYASPTPLVMPPKEWREDPEASSLHSIKATSARQLGEATTSSAAKAYFPTEKGIALFVTRSSAETGLAHGPAARAALEAFRGSAERAKLLGGTITVVEEKEIDEASQHVATMTWTDTSTGFTTVSRLVLAANQGGIVAVTGECVWGTEVAPALADACKQALATIDTGIQVAERVPVTLADTAALPPAATPPSSTGPQRPQIEPARLDDSDRLRMTPMSISQSKRETDRRPVYVGAGIVVLAVIFWWNRRRRDVIDRERASEEGRDPATASPATDDDADADDLRAAARGDAPKDEDA